METYDTTFKLENGQLVILGDLPPAGHPLDINPIEAFSLLSAENRAPEFKCWAKVGDLDLTIDPRLLTVKLGHRLDYCEAHGRTDFRTRYWCFFNDAGQVTSLWCKSQEASHE